PMARLWTVDWESCMTMNDSWGFKAADDNWKSAETLVHNLVDITAKGGNYLLNVGPTAEGLFPQESVERLAEMGDWMDINSEAIYGSRLWGHYEDGETVRYTNAGGHIYAVSLGWPGRELVLSHVQPQDGSEIHMLGYEQPLSWSYDEAIGLTIMLPGALQDEGSRPCKYAFAFRIVGGPVGGVEEP
ncbi:alpha-L-fucosidase, partial [Gemmatimonadota bacterium]